MEKACCRGRCSSQLTPSSDASFAMGTKMSGCAEFFGAVEAFRGNADDGVRMLVDADRSAHDVGVGAEIVLPGRPGNHRGLRSTGMVVIGALQQAAEERLDADDLEVLTAHFGIPRRAG